jgi:hypothetical protein
MSPRAPTLCPACQKTTRTVSGLCPNCGRAKPGEPGPPGRSPSARRVRSSFFDIFDEAGPLVEVMAYTVAVGLVIGALLLGGALAALALVVVLVALVILALALGGQL